MGNKYPKPVDVNELDYKSDFIHRPSKACCFFINDTDSRVEESETEPLAVVVDVETTGLIRVDGTPTKKKIEENPTAFPRIVEFAWCVVYTDKNGKLNFAEPKSYIIQQEEEVPEKAKGIHGISMELSQTGITITEALEIFSNDIQGCSYVVGHNVMFDKKVIESEYVRAGLKKPFTNWGKKDTMSMVRGFVDRKRPSLTYAAETILGNQVMNYFEWHRAIDDMLATTLLFKLMYESGIDY
jgi:DNA polymerase III epsilon subunit-like protein